LQIAHALGEFAVALRRLALDGDRVGIKLGGLMDGLNGFESTRSCAKLF
jgi:hypothetical protein